MFKRTVAVTFLMISAAAAGLAAEVRGVVVGPGQNPVRNAVVMHRESGARTETDAEGAFVLDVPGTGRVRLEVIHPDYYEREFLVGRKAASGKVVLVVSPLIKQKEEV